MKKQLTPAEVTSAVLRKFKGLFTIELGTPPVPGKQGDPYLLYERADWEWNRMRWTDDDNRNEAKPRAEKPPLRRARDGKGAGRCDRDLDDHAQPARARRGRGRRRAAAGLPLADRARPDRDTMRYFSICSGIEAASVAWHPLGWQAVGFAENDKFASAVLAHHYPDVPNYGDITKFKDWPDAAFDVLVGGTPCQSFSVAGLRNGLADPRGNLALVYLAIAERYKPRWLIWENVPGVLSSSGGRDFGSFLGGLVELGYGFAYRVLDAQYCRVDGLGRAVPQRRGRVFVVGCLGDWRRAAAVLFERESLCWDTPPRRETRERVAPTIAARPRGGGGLGTDFDRDGGLIPSISHPLLAKGNDSFGDTLQSYLAFGGNNTAGPIEVATARNGHSGPHGRLDFESETFVAHSSRADGFDGSEDGTGRGTPLVPVSGFNNTGQGWWNDADVAAGLRDMSASPLFAAGHHGDNGADSTGGQAIAFNHIMGAKAAGIGASANIRAASGGSSRSYVAGNWAVRRLTPKECCRLQGFPDDYLSQVTWRGKSPPPDGPMYKALGNSFAVNVARWIGTRIQMVENTI